VKAVLDTNVLIAAFLTEGLCARLLARARKRQFLLVACPFILQEFEYVLTKRFLATRGEAREALELLSEAVEAVVHPTEHVAGLCREADDDHILTCVLAADADYLVTGDLDLLELRRFGRAQIILPRDFEMIFAD
jgi:putative PIN family toxin of toxin-antitoxin system